MAEPLSEEEIFRRKVRALWAISLGLLKEVERVIVIPDKNCSCHRNPPCGDCENYGGLRSYQEELELLLREMEDEVMR